MLTGMTQPDSGILLDVFKSVQPVGGEPRGPGSGSGA